MSAAQNLITSLRHDRALSQAVLARFRAHGADRARELFQVGDVVFSWRGNGKATARQRQGKTCKKNTLAWPRDDHRIATQVALIGTSNNDSDVQQKSCSTHHSLRTLDTAVLAPETLFQPVPHADATVVSQ